MSRNGIVAIVVIIAVIIILAIAFGSPRGGDEEGAGSVQHSITEEE